MRLVGEERREFQRLRIDPPIPATFGKRAVSVVEVGILGARVRHADAIPEEYGELRFTSGGNEVVLRCEVVRRTGEAPSLESGIRFLAAVGESGDRLRELLARLVAHEFEVRRNLPKHSIPVEATVDGDKTVRGRDAGFLCYRLEKNGHWERHRAFLPEQPATGFTVARWVEPAEIKRLCQVYEAADKEGRRLIQLFAELSVSDELEIPPSADIS
ncbi:MAG TPA: PilZ domain-containing protein [Thermoanaerobaculia bacterium]|nr:PilZ domain-containing protein [Thermoanaerobaculia bacterium]